MNKLNPALSKETNANDPKLGSGGSTQPASAFVRVPRSLVNGSYGTEKRVYSKFEASIDLIQSARYASNQKQEYISGRLITWGCGQLPASIRFLADKWQWSNEKVKRYLDREVLDQNLKIDTDQGQTVITILDENSRTGYAEKPEHQQVQQTEQRRVHPKPTPAKVSSLLPNSDKYTQPNAVEYTGRTATSTKQKEGVIRIKKIIEIQYAHEGHRFKKVMDDWIIHLKELKAKITASAQQKQIDFLKKYTEAEAIRIIDTSIRNGYKGLFEPKNRQYGNSSSADAKTKRSSSADIADIDKRIEQESANLFGHDSDQSGNDDAQQPGEWTTAECV